MVLPTRHGSQKHASNWRVEQSKEQSRNPGAAHVQIAIARLDAARASEAVGRVAADSARESRRIIQDRYETPDRSGHAAALGRRRAAGRYPANRRAREPADGNSDPATSDRKAMEHITANHHLTVAAVAAALLTSHGAGRMLATPGRRRTQRRGRADCRHDRPGCDHRPAHRHRVGGVVQARTTAAIAARILAPVRESACRQAIGPRRPDADRARRCRSRRGCPCRARGGGCRRTGRGAPHPSSRPRKPDLLWHARPTTESSDCTTEHCHGPGAR